LLRVIIRLLLNNLSSKGNYLNLLARLKSVNNKGINKRDVYFNVFNTFNSFNVLKFYYKGRIVFRKEGKSRVVYIEL
jgi:hypothetical protein